MHIELRDFLAAFEPSSRLLQIAGSVPMEKGTEGPGKYVPFQDPIMSTWERYAGY